MPEHDFKPRLADLLRKAYAPILEVLDPATATQLDVENALRGYEPTGQLQRMVQLFIQLMTYAGVMPEGKGDKPSRGTGASRAGSGTAGRKRETSGGPDKPARETPPRPPARHQDTETGHLEQPDRNTFILYMVSGPKITLTVDMDVMRVSVPDREFIFKLVDALREYDTEPAQASGGEQEPAGDSDEQPEAAS